MAAVLYSASGPDGNSTNLQNTTVGGSKPLHRFINREPRIVGIIVLILGTSFIIVSMSAWTHEDFAMWRVIPPAIVQGAMFVLCGILYILTEQNPTKKTVTISLALSIMALLVTCWSIINLLPEVMHKDFVNYEFIHHDNGTETVIEQLPFEVMAFSIEVTFLFYSFVGAAIFIGMSALAGAALRSTKSQAIVVMTATPPEQILEQ